MLERLCGPNVITIEGDVLPAERSDMGKQIVTDNFTVGAQFGQGITPTARRFFHRLGQTAPSKISDTGTFGPSEIPLNV
jgi:hypothetical protein